MVKEAQSHASEDESRRQLIDVRNQADSLAYQVEKTLNDNRGKLPAGEVAKIESALADLKTAAAGDNVAAITAALETLQRASHAVAEQLYKGAAQGSGSGGGSQGTGRSNANEGQVKEGEVVDAEYAETAQ
jgi:molecular chaperone DnaK